VVSKVCVFIVNPLVRYCYVFFPYDTAWGLPVASYMVIIMGVQYYEGKEHCYIDYLVMDVVSTNAKGFLQEVLGRRFADRVSPSDIFYMITSLPKSR
jgi:hypothetical protein